MSHEIEKNKPQKVEVKRLDHGRPITAGERHADRAVALWRVQQVGGQAYRLARLVCGHVVGFPVSSTDGRSIRMEVNLDCPQCAGGQPFDYRRIIEGDRGADISIAEMRRVEGILDAARARIAKHTIKEIGGPSGDGK